MRNLSLGFLTRSDTNGAVQAKRLETFDLVEGFYYLFNENRGAD